MLGISKGRISPADQLVLFHEDFSQKDVNEALVGRKGYSLFRLREMDIPVPDFFVVSPTVFKSHMLGAFEGKLDKLVEKMDYPDAHELEKLIMRADFEDDFLDELASAYSRLSGFSKAWVAVRSSVVFPQNKDISFSGLFKTELNVRGFDHLVKAIKNIYISVFRDRVARYANTHGVKLSDLQMSIVIQKMVQPEVAGVAYTVDPITNSKDKVSIEAVFGLGDVISDGEITPDQYILDKKDLTILEKHISPQEWMKIRKPRGRNDKQLEEFEKIQISKSWSHQQKLEDRHIELVSKLALVVEDKSNLPQAVEWVWESGGVWVLQTKDLFSSKPLEAIVSMPKEGNSKKDSKNDSKKVNTPNESLLDFAVDMVKEGKEKDLTIRTRNLTSAVEDKSLEDYKIPKDVVKNVKKVEKDLVGRGLDLENDLQSMLATGVSSTVNTKKDAEKEVKEIRKEQDSLERLEKLERKLASVLRKNQATEMKSKSAEETKSKAQILETGIAPEPKEKEMQFLLSGIGASFGAVVGTIKSVKNGTEIVTKQNILVLKSFNTDIESRVLESGGVIMDEGGITSDVALLCRENNIPAVVGTAVASSILKDGDVVKIDGNVGSVYRALTTGDLKKVDAVEANKAKPVPEKMEVNTNKSKDIPEAQEKITYTFPRTATKVFLKPELGKTVESYADLLKYVDGVSCVDLEKLMLQNRRHPLSHVANKTYSAYVKPIEKYVDEITDLVDGSEVIAVAGSSTAGEFKELIKGKALESENVTDNAFGLTRLLANKDFAKREFSIVKRLRNTYRSRNVSLGIHSPMSGSMMTEAKREITSMGLKRTKTFNIYAVLDRSSELALANEILNAQIDGVIICAKRIAKELQGLAVTDDKSPYHVDNNSVIKLIEEAIVRLKPEGIRIFLQTDDNEKLVKMAIKAGVYGVIVSEDYYSDAKELVASEEAKMVMNIGR